VLKSCFEIRVLGFETCTYGLVRKFKSLKNLKFVHYVSKLVVYISNVFYVYYVSNLEYYILKHACYVSKPRSFLIASTRKFEIYFVEMFFLVSKSSSKL